MEEEIAFSPSSSSSSQGNSSSLPMYGYSIIRGMEKRKKRGEALSSSPGMNNLLIQAPRQLFPHFHSHPHFGSARCIISIFPIEKKNSEFRFGFYRTTFSRTIHFEKGVTFYIISLTPDSSLTQAISFRDLSEEKEILLFLFLCVWGSHELWKKAPKARKISSFLSLFPTGS